MRANLTTVLVWAPRVLGILVALFLAIPAFDTLENTGYRSRVLAFLVNLLPCLLVAATVVVAWRTPLVGAIALLVLGVAYLIHFRGRFPWYTYAIVSGPVFLTGALYFVSHLLGRTPRG